MGNDDACKDVSVGTMKVKMYDDIVRIFSNVQHVPDLRKNLISLGIFEENSFIYLLREGNMKICKGTLVVIQGGHTRCKTLQQFV